MRNEEYTRLRLALLDRKRQVLLRLRHEGTIDDSVARRIQTRLDIEELRLTGVEPFRLITASTGRGRDVPSPSDTAPPHHPEPRIRP